MKEEKIIMLLDDNEIDNFIHKKMLEDKGVTNHVLVMGTVEKALNYFKEQSSNMSSLPHLIVLDINLPAITGFGFLREFRKLPPEAQKKCKIVVLTSSDKDEDIVQMESDPLVKAYFVKPLSNEALQQIKGLLR